MSAEAVLAGVRVGTQHPVRLMAVINVSPESFYPGSVRADAAALRDAALQLEGEGADFVDVGAMSTAPYLDAEIPAEEEERRMAWALEILAPVVRVPLSADTRRSSVAARALQCGARVVNDVSGLRGDPRMAAVAAGAEGLVAMASETGCPPVASDDPIAIVSAALSDSMRIAAEGGIALESIVLDPGIGFFTRQATPAVEFNCTVLRRLPELAALQRPLLIGVSRKSFVGKLTGRADPRQRLHGSLAATAIAVAGGAALVRTHDVAATRDAVRVAEALRQKPLTVLARS